ncbi:MAG: Ig-like domain-containing protein [Clostridia bacterium]|nr:Ig-like domain-containing protein [Clostridia bacterium]
MENCIPVSSIVLEKTKLYFDKVGTIKTLRATVLPTNATYQDLIWQSNNPDVVVCDTYEIHAVGPGSAAIIVASTDGSGVAAVCTVDVVDKSADYIELSDTSLSMRVGTAACLHATVYPYETSNQCVEWSSSDSNIVSVDPETGYLEAWSPGYATIIAKSTDGRNLSAKCHIVVYSAIKVTGVSLSDKKIEIQEGTFFDSLIATVYPYNATNKGVSFTSNNTKVAKDFFNGMIEGVSPGTAIITVTTDDGGYTDTCTVTVTAKKPQPTIESANSNAPESTVADPVDAYTGAHLLTHTLMNLFGGQQLKLVANYDSTKLVVGSMGIGWNHSFEKNLEFCECEIRVYNNPSVYSKYIPNDDETKYYCESKNKRGYCLTVDVTQENPYVIDCNEERKEYYNADGLLAKIVDHQGFETFISYEESIITITDSLTNKTIYLEKDESGKIVRVYDDSSRQCILTYENNMLTNICDVNGNNISYTYTHDGQVLTGTDAEGICYFTNTYDEYGRVSTQKDGVAQSNETSFNYGENGERITINRNGDESVRVFNSDGLLIRYTDENGNTKTYEYDEYYNIIKETDNNGNSIIKTYNKFNKPTSITDKNGNVTRLVYNNFGDIIRIEYPKINGVTPIETFTYNSRNQLSVYTDLRGTTTQYFYDDSGLLTRKISGSRVVETVFENGLLVNKTDANGNVETYCYNAIGQQTSMVDAVGNVFSYEYDNLGNIIKTTDSDGNCIETQYDGNNQKEYVIDANGNKTEYSYNGNMKNTLVKLPDGSTISYEYDGEDRLIKLIDQAGNNTITEYDKVGNVLSKTLADGSTTEYTYDKVGNVLTETNSKGAVTTKTYDAKGNVLTVIDNDGNLTRYDYDAVSRVVRKTNAVSGSTVYEYSPAGDLLSEIDALGNKKTYSYDTYGNKLTVKDAKGNITAYTYDNNNNVLTVCDALGNIITNRYDGNNRLVETKDAKGNVKKYAYDCQGRCTHITDAKNNVFETVYDANGNILKVIDAKGNTIIEKTYNSLNLPYVIKDSTGNITTNLYNELGKIRLISDQCGNTKTFSYNSRGFNSSVIDARSGQSAATYDALGNIVFLTGPLGGATYYEYDDMGKLVSETTPTGGMVTYGYNELNIKDYIKNAKGQIRKCYYDALGRTTGYICEEDTVSYTYDANGNVTMVIDKNGTVVREYDALNRVTKYTDTFGRTIGYEYDVVGNLKRLIYPDNTVVEYDYDANNNLISVRDWANNVTTYIYDENNKVTDVLRPDGSTTKTVYDYLQRVISTIDKSSLGAIITGFEYSYDALGRIESEKNLENNTIVWYNYDELGRMTSRIVKDLSGAIQAQENYSYDAAGNIISAPDGSYEYDQQNNVLSSFNNSIAITDADGNLISVCIDGVTTSNFKYDSANRLIKTDNNEYTYNAENIRIKNLCGDSEITYTYNTNCRLSQLLYTEENGVITKYVYGRGLIGDAITDSFRVYHFDYRGSTVAITSLCGSEIVRINYDAYGNILNTADLILHNLIFCYNGRDGVITDDNGLLYMRARYYCPKLRRFINADILHGEIADSTSLNRYSYVNGNPVSLIDPLGMSAERTSDSPSYWDLFKNADGTYSLYDNRRHNPNSVFHEQMLSISLSGPSFDLLEGNIGLGSVGIDGFNGGWEWEYVDLSLLDFGHAEAGAEFKNGNLYVGAFASAYSPSVSFKIFGVKIEIGAEVGAIGGKLNVGTDGFSAKAAYGLGLSLSISW